MAPGKREVTGKDLRFDSRRCTLAYNTYVQSQLLHRHIIKEPGLYIAHPGDGPAIHAPARRVPWMPEQGPFSGC